MLNNDELIELEKKYFNLIKDTISANLGKIISQICSQKMFEDLANYGIVPNKTHVINKLYLEKIPEQFQRAYIRGLFDGDGGISFTGNINEVSCDFTSYFYETVEEFQLFIDKQIGKEKHNINSNEEEIYKFVYDKEADTLICEVYDTNIYKEILLISI